MRNGDVRRKVLLTGGVVSDSPDGAWMCCLCNRDRSACTLHNADAANRWRMAVALRKAIASGAFAEGVETLQ